MFTYEAIRNINYNCKISVIFGTKSEFVFYNFDNMKKKNFCEPQLITGSICLKSAQFSNLCQLFLIMSDLP